MTTRLVSQAPREEDALDTHLRPQRLMEFVGQSRAKQNLQVFIDAAKARGEALDHVLFAGPPGLGKTTLAQIVARELGVNFRATSGPVIAKAGDLAAVALTDLLGDGLSMVYSFYNADDDDRSLGTFMVLDHIEQARSRGLPYVYLGYWIEGSRKMAYKVNFQPIEGLVDGRWQALRVGPEGAP